MLQNSSSLIDAMITVCQHQDALQTAINCIEFGQFVTQAMWTKDSSLLQLPHFTKAEAEHCSKGKNAAASIKEYIAMEDGEKKGMANFSATQKEDVLKTCSLIPDLTVETKVFVEDDEDDQVYEGDLLTINVTLT